MYDAEKESAMTLEELMEDVEWANDRACDGAWGMSMSAVIQIMTMCEAIVKRSLIKRFFCSNEKMWKKMLSDGIINPDFEIEVKECPRM